MKRQLATGVMSSSRPLQGMMNTKRVLKVKLNHGGPQSPGTAYDIYVLWYNGSMNAVKEFYKFNKNIERSFVKTRIWGEVWEMKFDALWMSMLQRWGSEDPLLKLGRKLTHFSVHFNQTTFEKDLERQYFSASSNLKFARSTLTLLWQREKFSLPLNFHLELCCCLVFHILKTQNFSRANWWPPYMHTRALIWQPFALILLGVARSE